jgi:pimeloyl-ACP methyl ester carboxylesterase
MVPDLESAGEGVAVVAVHPFPFDHDVFRPQLDAAATGGLGCEFIAVKLPGFGGSAWPPDHPPVLRVEDVAADLVDLTVTLGLDRPVLVGAGFGGYAVLRALAVEPHCFRAGFVMGCKPAGDARSNRPVRARAARTALELGGAAAADLLAVASLSPIQRVLREPVAREMVLRADVRAIAAAVWGIHLRPDPRPELHRITVPLLVAAGADDQVCGQGDARLLSELVVDGRFQVVDRCGHGVPLERPDVVTTLLAELLDEVAD